MAEFASRGVANTGLGLGIAGTALALMANNTGALGGIIGGNNYATKESVDAAIALASKDSQIALLEAQKTARDESIAVYERVMTRVNEIKAGQDAVNMEQAVYNATNNSAVSVMQGQVAQLMSLTKMVVPAANVCPNPMPLYNSWTAPTNPTT